MLNLRWPWRRQTSNDQLVVSWSGQELAYVLARAGADGTHEVLKFGVEHPGGDSTDVLVPRLNALGLKGLTTHIMLRPEQYQLLQIDAPPVAPEELRAAARYQIREMIQSHVDDVTLDVMRVGDREPKSAGHLFVVVATNAVVRGMLQLGSDMHWTVPVIDIQETAQRNLQSALAAREGQPERANAALVLVDGQQAVLTISANEELFYSRRFDLPEGFLAASWGQAGAAAVAPTAAATGAGSFTPVEEYVPDYSVGGVSQGSDYSIAPAVNPAPVAGAANGAVARAVVDDERAQRFLVEVQRSLDVWDRSWSSKPLGTVRVYAGERTEELAKWLAVWIGQTVLPLDVKALFPGFSGGAAADRALCLPLLGVLLRSESRHP
jgi:MSHA biogenesis protein MshI